MPTRGLVYEEFELEKSFTTPGRTVTETDVVQFAALSGDYTSLHTDEVNHNDKVVSTGFWECVMLSQPEPTRS